MTNLKRMRELRGLTQTELAIKSDVNMRTIQNYEQGKANINKGAVITIHKLSRALDCSMLDIME
jgi:transcriptional regulator with XRE-family HTH domain